MLTIYPPTPGTGLTMVSGEIETDFELALAREAISPIVMPDPDDYDSNGITYRYVPIEKGTFVTWMVKS